MRVIVKPRKGRPWPEEGLQRHTKERGKKERICFDWIKRQRICCHPFMCYVLHSSSLWPVYTCKAVWICYYKQVACFTHRVYDCIIGSEGRFELKHLRRLGGREVLRQSSFSDISDQESRFNVSLSLSLLLVCYWITTIKYLYVIKSQRLKIYPAEIISFPLYVRWVRITKYIHHIKCEGWTYSPRVYLLWIGIITFEISMWNSNIFHL